MTRSVEVGAYEPPPRVTYTEGQRRALRYVGAFDTRPESVKQAAREARRNVPKDDFREAAKAARQAGYDVEY